MYLNCANNLLFVITYRGKLSCSFLQNSERKTHSISECRKIFNTGAVPGILNLPVINYFQHVPSIWEDILWCADIPENELQHDVFTVQGEKSPEEAQ